MGDADDNPPVNRSLDDKALDDVDHALGRPVWPLRVSYRNHYAIEDESPQAKEFDASPHWVKSGCLGRMAYYSVTEEGRLALAKHLKATSPVKAFVVRYRGHERIIPAATASKARYSYYQDVHEVLPDLTFAEFSTDARVRAA